MNDGVQPSDRDDGSAQRRRLPGPERRVVILGAALRTFAARGYDGSSMDEIASAAGVSKAVIYDHVSSKRELYTLLLDSIRGELVDVVETAILPAPGGEEGVQRGIEAFFGYVEEHPAASRLLILELQGTIVSSIGRELEQRISLGLAATLGADTRLFGGHPQRERQLYVLAELLKSAAAGLASWWFRNPEVPREDLVARTVEVVWPAIERARAGVRA